MAANVKAEHAKKHSKSMRTEIRYSKKWKRIKILSQGRKREQNKASCY